MPKPKRFIYVCANNRPEGHPRGSCSQKGGGAVLMKFAEVMDANGLVGEVGLAQTGCVGPCFLGPLVAIQPDNCWYKEVSPEDVAEIVTSHLVGGEPVARLVMEEDDWD